MKPVFNQCIRTPVTTPPLAPRRRTRIRRMGNHAPRTAP
jgi:hypothetical protein